MTTLSPSPVSAPPSQARLSGLDGLRAIAVALVMIYHLFPPAFAGGFIGVDVFFVVSGFLITTLLLRERARTGRVSLRGFWQRRARRLLPAVAVMLAVCATAAWFIGGDVLVGIGRQILAALTFTYNWAAIAAGSSYFSADTPELFRNLWSLGIEEQFYLLWPLLFILLMLLRQRWLRTVIVLVAAIASAVWMATIVAQGSDTTRAYFGTDSHAFGLLGGVALAFGWNALPSSPPAWMLRSAVRRSVTAVGALALVGIVALALAPATTTTVTFPGALVAASVLSLIVITAGIWPAARFGSALDVAPLRYIGNRSYGLYLWHWPLLVLMTAWATGLSPDVHVPVWVGIVTLVLSFAAAEISYRVIETPIRTLGFRGSARRWGQRIVESAATRWATLGAGALFVVLAVGAGSAVASAPHQTSAEAAVQAGLDALAEEQPSPAAPSQSPSPSPEPSDVVPSAAPLDDPSGEPSDDPGSGAAAGEPGKDVPAVDPTVTPSANPGFGPTLAPTAAPVPISGDQVTAIGDSVMLAAAPALMEQFPGIEIDAAVSRSMWAGPGILQSLADSGKLRPFVIIALGTNGAVDAGALADVRRIAGPERQVILVNAFAPRSWIDGVNHDLAAFAAENQSTWVADWSTAIAGHPELLAGDQIHPQSGGGVVFAEIVRAEVETAEAARLAEASRPREGAFILEKYLTFTSRR